MSISEGAFVAAAVFVAAVLRGFSGFGFALAAVPLLGIVIPPAQAVTLALLLQFAGGLSDLSKASLNCDWRSLRWLMLGALLGSPIGMWVLTMISPAMARIMIATATIGAVAAVGAGPTGGATIGPRTTLPFGFASGLLNGIAAMPGPPVIVYYMVTPFPYQMVRASLLVFFLVTSTIGLASAIAFGAMTWEAVKLGVVGLPALWLGTFIGAALFRHGSERAYRGVAVACLVAIAVASAVPGLLDLAKPHWH